MYWDRFLSLLNSNRLVVAKVMTWLQRVILLMAIAYVAASSMSAWFASLLVGSTMQRLVKTSTKPTTAALNFNSNYNYHPLVKVIKDRNLFNAEGKFPEETNTDTKSQEGNRPSFDINAACSKPTVNVELVGTIFTGSTGSLATLQEQGYSEADVYREGDLIIGNEQAAVVRIERNRVILNNKGKKECLELAISLKDKNMNNIAINNDMSNTPAAVEAGGAGNNCVFDEKYVQSELGSGFGTIIQKARLVPNTTDNVMNGFKIFAIDSSSLLAKTGLQNGDIITQVNETSLKQPEQGFALYQALQDEKEVRIHILRQGTTPMTLVCRIK